MTEQPVRKTPRAKVLEVLRTERLSPHLIRVVLGGPGLAEFVDNDFTDHYVKLQFGPAGVSYPKPFDLGWIRENLPREQWPVSRTYTVRSFDGAELVIDFVHHGDEGIAGPWAANAKPGDELALMGPGGAYAPNPAADWHLMVGDESAIPAIAGALEKVPTGVPVKVVLEVTGPEDEMELATPGAAEFVWLHRGEAAPGTTSLLLDHVKGMDFPEGRVHAFVHGEGNAVMKQLRPHLFGERGIARDQVSISGYWRQGRTEESFREWKSELAAADKAAA
ncbi:siderophore-interacting protein [Actinorhabdospora filicis]|uniref:Siderophore-interacting protein n=1 Tax=Actinorhabdospora filicis TaxID=1785913 RepID=A0A9W6W6U4_9ACTN|nr:siderophore-interacting protein [Actinorhabdospora filicis]GLZ75904.1 siderophore-interacting protein [Actinorhabdospora filicis]